MNRIKMFIKFLVILITFILLLSAAYYFYPEKSLPGGIKIERILVEKSKREMHVYSKGKKIKTYKIAIGKQPEGKKRFQGDRKTPEGKYRIFNKNPYSGWYLNLGVSYPDDEDRAYAAKHSRNPGGDIKIHGIKENYGWIDKFHRFFNWTDGCIAVTNREMKELYDSVIIGSEIEIVP